MDKGGNEWLLEYRQRLLYFRSQQLQSERHLEVNIANDTIKENEDDKEFVINIWSSTLVIR